MDASGAEASGAAPAWHDHATAEAIAILATRARICLSLMGSPPQWPAFETMLHGKDGEVPNGKRVWGTAFAFVC
ncbi:hypothetical protein B0G57_110135 [Trinickia symbiotica]|nr:hypothetical protein B0G57_110135 [Trinickia symbiotica]